MKNFDVLIKAKEEYLEELNVELAEIKQEILKEMAIYAHSWMEERVKRIIEEEGDKIIALGEEKAKTLKSEVSELISNIPNLVDELIGDEKRWWHEAEFKLEEYFRDREALEKVENGVRLVFGKLAEIFDKYDVIKVEKHSSTGYGQEWKISQEGVKYGYSVDHEYNTEMRSCIAEYVSKTKESIRAEKEIEKLKEEKKQSNVQDWWNSL